MTSTRAAAIALQDRAALWSMGEVRAIEVVNAACDALVAGLDTPGLRTLAALTRAEADYDVHDLLPAALDELGLTFYPVADEAGREAAARALARRMLAGELTPREFTEPFSSCLCGVKWQVSRGVQRDEAPGRCGGVL
ncbi:hypothetical protein ACFYUZ_35160, partial [Streptomyces sp. NPDC004266]